MKKNLITLGVLVSVIFAGAAFACDMPRMQDHSIPCSVKDNKTISKENTVPQKSDSSSTKVKKTTPKPTHVHKH